jgi:F0F1-type ATP synthase assembly protein I
MLSGMVVWGGVGWLLDRWWETQFLALVGSILGLTVAIYLVVVKYGAVDPPPAGRKPRSTSPAGRRGPTGTTQKGRR